MTDSFIVKCEKCGQKNRVQLRGGPTCGRCKASLAAPMADVIVEAAAKRGEQRREAMMREIARTAEEVAARREGSN